MLSFTKNPEAILDGKPPAGRVKLVVQDSAMQILTNYLFDV